MYVQYIFVMEFCISEHFCEAAVPHRCRWKITTFFCLSYALLPILKSTKLFGSKEKNTNLLLNSNDLQQRKKERKKIRTVKCTFSSPPNHAIVAYTPFYKVWRCFH